MSWLDTYHAFARYNRWMNQRLYSLTGELDDADRKRDLGAFFGSLHDTLGHLVLADRVWLGRFTAQAERFADRAADGRPLLLTPRGAFASFEDMRERRVSTDAAIEEWVATLDEATLDAPFEYANLAGEPQSHVRWWAVQHFFNHQTHHRGQATTLLKQLGKDPGVTDYVQFMRLEAAGRA